jgi:uncharacterized membrane protein required for colicin V production
MISLAIIFWIMVVFFSLIGYLRGWQKEAIALSGLIASVAVLQQFGYELVNLIGAATVSPDNLLADPNYQLKQQFWIQAVFHATTAFFSYQVVAKLADNVTGGRLGERLRANLEKRIIGGLLGLVNGYLLMGGLWSFLEYQITPNGYVPLQPGVAYVFDATVVSRPLIESSAMQLVAYLPMGVFTPTIWLLLFFIAFFVVIIALI